MNVLFLILGVLLVAAPFVAVTVFAAKGMGWKVALGVWVVAVGVIGFVLGGVALFSLGAS